jgi:3-phenylpropionate/trans-cinnamate dioxygenase ferredoxin reductase component
MKAYKYLIVGGGMTADAALHGILEIDPTGSIGLIGDETDLPYNRPALSKGLWKNKPLESIWRKTETLGADLHLGHCVTAIDPAGHTVTDDKGEIYKYEKLLLATGGTPRRLPFGGDHIIYYRNLADYRRLRQISAHAQSFAVIGGGFIGSEIAAALAMNGKKVTMLMPETGIGTRLFPPDLAEFVTAYFRQKGVEVVPGDSLVKMDQIEGGYRLTTRTGRTLVAEGVVAGIGLQPNIDLALQAGIKVDRHIVVDEYLRTSQPDIYAAGDVVEFYNPILVKTIHVEHEDNANQMGRQAGRNMAGAGEPYNHLPFFYSDLFELGYEAVGDVDSRLEIVADWEERFQKGVLYYLAGGRVRGVLLWNVWGQVDNARRLMAETGPFSAADLKGRLGEKKQPA